MGLLANLDHEKFAQHYAAHGHVGEAAAHVGLTSTRAGQMLLQNPKVAARIEELVGDRYARANITADRVMKELARIAFADPREMWDMNGELRPIHELDDDAAAAIAQVKVELNGTGRGASRVVTVTKNIKMADKMGALGLLSRHFKIVGDADDGVNQLANVLADKLKAARQRSARELTDVEDAVLLDRAAALPKPGARLEYAIPGEDDDPTPVDRWQMVEPDPEALHSPYATAERVRPAAAGFGVTPAPAPQPAPAPAAGDDDDEDLR